MEKWTAEELKNAKKLTHNCLCNNTVRHIVINIGNNYEHEFKKFKTAWNLAMRGHKFYVEAIFHNGKRADIFDVTENKVYEVLCSETEEEALEKVKEYPVDDIVFVKCKKSKGDVKK